MYFTSTIAAVACLVEAGLCTSLWQDTPPQTPQPFTIKKGLGVPLVSTETLVTKFPITGNSTGNAFSIMQVHGSASTLPNAFPHVHMKTYETFYSSKGRLQMWGQNYDSFLAGTSNQTTRYMTEGDFCAIPNNTIHLFQLLEPDTKLTAVLLPGTFERFFFSTASIPTANVTAPQNATELAPWDVYPEPSFIREEKPVDGKAGPGNWHDGPNELPATDSNPVWIAKDFGPKWLHSKDGVYQIISPLVSSKETRAVFTQGTITMSKKPRNAMAVHTKSSYATAFLVEEGQLAVWVNGYQPAFLIDGDIFSVPPNTTFSYNAEADFTRFMYVSAGPDGFDTKLIANSTEWSSAFYPLE